MNELRGRGGGRMSRSIFNRVSVLQLFQLLEFEGHCMALYLDTKHSRRTRATNHVGLLAVFYPWAGPVLETMSHLQSTVQ
jgi:hypothetical protein